MYPAIEYVLKQRIISIRPSIFTVSESLGLGTSCIKHIFSQKTKKPKRLLFMWDISLFSCSLGCVWLLCTPMDCRPPASSVHGIFQARILDLVSIFYFRGFSRPRDQIHISCTAGRFFTTEALAKWDIFTDNYHMRN